MFLGKVIGRIWATVKSPSLEGHRLLVVQPIRMNGEPNGRAIICTDAVGVGTGETVYCCRGKESSFPFLPREVVTDVSIVGTVDRIDAGGEEFLC